MKKYYFKNLGGVDIEAERDEWIRRALLQVFAWNPDGTYNPDKTIAILETGTRCCPICGSHTMFWVEGEE